MFELTEGCDILLKISASLSHEIALNNGLPKIICASCYRTVKNIYKFREMILQNEITLQNKLSDLYKSIDPINCSDTNIVQQDKGNFELSNDSLTSNTVNEETSNNIDATNSFTTVFVRNTVDDPNGQMDQSTELIHSEVKEHIDTNTVSNANFSSEDELLFAKPIKNENPVNLDPSDCLMDENMCLTCFKKFPNRLDLLEHYQNYERQKLSTKENEKDKKLPLKYKIHSSSGTMLYKCEQCKKEYKTKKYIMRHFLTHRDRPFLCKLCGRTYRTAIEIANHSKVHGGALYICSHKCGYSSVHKHVVKDHERRHNNEYKYSCDICGKRFQVKTWYSQHKNVHTGEKPFVCNICGMAFHLDRYLTQHRSNVHPEAETQKRYVCMHCSIPCGSKNSLVMHLKEHNISTNILCDECGKVLKSAHQLKCHKRIHMDPRAYGCSMCEKRFAKKSNLTVHVRSHTGEKYACDQCPKRFTQRSSLNRHKQRCRCYSQKCPKCKETFSIKKDFIKHQISCS